MLVLTEKPIRGLELFSLQTERGNLVDDDEITNIRSESLQFPGRGKWYGISSNWPARKILPGWFGMPLGFWGGSSNQ